MNPLSKVGRFGFFSSITVLNYTKLVVAKLRHAPKEKYVEIYQDWAKELFKIIGYEVEQTGEKPFDGPCIYVGNHVSFLDIPLVWTAAQAEFVSKTEVRYWPVIGLAATALGTIYVDRSSLISRAKVLDSLKEEILEKGKRVCIFPEGTSTVEGTPWKWGAFRIAAQFNIPVQPFRIFYCPLRETAYEGDDTLTTQYWRMLNSPRRLASMEWGKAQKIVDFKKDAQVIQQWVRASFDKKRAECNCG